MSRQLIPKKSIAGQRGSLLVEIAIGLMILSLLTALAAAQIKRQIDDNAAESTGRYLMQVRGAVLELQLAHEAWLRGVDVSSAPAGTYPAPPSLSWSAADGAQVARGSVDDLISLGFLSPGIPRYPSLGDAVRFALVRQGTCPGSDCKISAYVYTCHPISAERSQRTNATCTAPAGARAQYSQGLLGQVVMSAGGYAGHDALGDRVRGPLLDVPRNWFDYGGEPGHVVVAAATDASPFTQFVRHGETRPVTLLNTLTVADTIQSNKGLMLKTAVVPGAPCSDEGLFAATAGKSLAVCSNGAWLDRDGYTITGTYTNLPHDSVLPVLNCPTGTTAWRQVALQSINTVATGSNVNIAGSIGGSITGSGSVNAAGNVTIGGAFSGTFKNSGTSYVLSAQSASINGNRIVISPADLNARASVIQGCKS